MYNQSGSLPNRLDQGPQLQNILPQNASHNHGNFDSIQPAPIEAYQPIHRQPSGYSNKQGLNLNKSFPPTANSQTLTFMKSQNSNGYSVQQNTGFDFKRPLLPNKRMNLNTANVHQPLIANDASKHLNSNHDFMALQNKHVIATFNMQSSTTANDNVSHQGSAPVYKTLNTVASNQLTSIDQGRVASQSRQRFAHNVVPVCSGLYRANDKSVHWNMNSGLYDSRSFQGGQSHPKNYVPSNSTHYSQQHGRNNQRQASSVVNQMNIIPVQQTMNGMSTQQFSQINIANDVGHASAVAKHHVNSIPAQHTVSNQASHYNHFGNHVALPQNQPYPSTSHYAAPDSVMPAYARNNHQHFQQTHLNRTGFNGQHSRQICNGIPMTQCTGVVNNRMPPPVMKNKPERPRRRRMQAERRNKDGSVRKKRYCFSFGQKHILTHYFYNKGWTKPATDTLELIAREVRADSRTVNVWFKNERQVSKNRLYY